MSSTFVADTSDDHKTDNTLIIIVNNDGTISVDQETLQNILANQQNTAVSVVRVGGPSQGDDSSQDSSGTCDSQNDGNPHVNLTVEGFYPSAVSSDAGPCASSAATTTSATTTTPAACVASATSSVDMVSDMVAPSAPVGGITPVAPTSATEGETLVDPFLEMDPEQLERLETALQSEQAKQILGENVTAMLDMLSVEEEATHMKDSILMDHCYTNRSPSTAPGSQTVPIPSATQQVTVSPTRDESGCIVINQAENVHQVLSAGMGAPLVQTIVRGRGRGRPGRPRRDSSATRGAPSIRGMTRGGLGRGGIKLQRGGTMVTGPGGSNMIMVQQIKQITPPLSVAGTSTTMGSTMVPTMVPLVRPLVITSTAAGQVQSGTVVRTSGSQVQKQIIAVPQGACLVAVQNKSGSVDTSNPQTVVLTNVAGQMLQTQQVQGVTSVPSQLSNASNAKVVVAKMPPMLPPHQFLGAETLPEQPKHLQKEDESDFTDFPHNPSEDSESEESDAGSDDEYKDPSVGRRGRGSKLRGRFGRGARSRGGYRVYESNRGGRGGRRGRGRNLARVEDIDKVKKLDAEMAGFVAAMETSPEQANVVIQKAPSHDALDKPIKKEDIPLTSDTSPETPKKKALKVYGKSPRKVPEDGGGEELQVKMEVIKEKMSHATPEKKSPILKSPLKHSSPEITSSAASSPAVATSAASAAVSASATPSAQSTPTSTVGSDSRKNYPKRENRKPPAHLAEALGPALFSTPDIIRRVSTGSEQKPTENFSEEKKDVKSSSGTANMEIVSEDKMHDSISETSEKEIQGLTVIADKDEQSVMDSPLIDTIKTEVTENETLLVNRDSLEAQNIDNSTVALKTSQIVSEPLSSSFEEESKSKKNVLHTPKTNTPKLQTSLAAKRTTRRYSSSSSNSQQNERKKGSKPTSLGRDKKKAQEGKPKGRRRMSEVDEDDDEDMPSSDDKSWNSEDDPDRLWCICKKPHNNRFMISCDVCEDWFHGKCVGVTKAMGKHMESKGIDWSCPNCVKKKEEAELKKNTLSAQKEKDIKRNKENKNEIVEKLTEFIPSETKEVIVTGEAVSQPSSSADAEIMYCIVCKKEARPSSIYCGDDCILKHAQESLNCISRDKAATPGPTGSAGSRSTQETQPSLQSSREGTQTAISSGGPIQHPPKTKADARVIVYERKTGILLAGPNAPTAGNLKSWLKDNPTFEVVRPGVNPTNKFYGTKIQGVKGLVSQPLKVPVLKPVLQQMKVSQASSSITSPALQTKPGVIHKVSVTPQKNTILIQQKSSSAPLKTVVAQQKIVTSVPSPVKVLPAKVLKGAIVVPAQPHKLVVKTPSKQATVVVKNGKSPIPASVPKIPSSPSSKTSTNVVSKAPATSTVKETLKPSGDKQIAKKVEVKRQSSSSDTKKEEEKDKEKDKPAGPEPIRLNVRKTLQELLQTRIQECSDLTVSESEVQNIAVNIEEEMHSFFRDTGIKYKSKYRSLVFNIKDPKNLTLFRKIADKSLSPHQLVRLSPEELASQELAQWREREVKHQLEMIKKTELDLMTQAKTYVMKTHKGEQVIETDETLKVEVPELVDPSSVPDLVSPVNNSVSSTVEDTDLDKMKSKIKDKDLKDKLHKEEKERNKDREKSKHDDRRREKSEKSKSDREKRDSHHDRHEKEKRRDSKERERSKSSSKEKHRSEKLKRESDKHRDSKNSSSRKDKKDDGDFKKDKTDKKENIVLSESNDQEASRSETSFIKEEVREESEINVQMDSNTTTKIEVQEDSDMSDREPSSTVTIKTPDINVEEQEKHINSTVWKGFVNMPDVAKFFTTVQIVSGDPQNLCSDLPDTVDIVGRIAPKTVWDYISKMKKTGTKEILVIRLTAANDEEKIPYITLYTYLSTRGRLGVVGNVSKMIKDFYIMPLASHLPVPQILLPLEGPGFEEYRPHLLIGIIVRARRKRLAPENEYVAKMPKRIFQSSAAVEPTERSYTPPLPGSDGDMLGSLTPPHPPPQSSGSYTPPSSPQAFLGGSVSRSKVLDPRLNRVEKDAMLENFNVDVPVASNKQSLTSRMGGFSGDDDDAPYSPGGSDDDVESSEDNMVAPKNPVELQRKVEELNRKIEEQKQQIQSISSAIVASDSSTTLGNVSESIKVNSAMPNFIMNTSSEETGAAEGDENEAYSPSRSFTPPSTSIPFLGPVESGSSPVFSKLPSNINLPSNLHEILATIKKQETDKASGSKGINLKADPIVQNYGKSDMEVIQTDSATDSFTSSGLSSSTPVTTTSVLHSASSALLSLATPIVHPLASGSGASTKVVDSKANRDPRQRVSEAVNKSSGSTLSTLSDDDLIKKALEMEMELTEPKIKTASAVEPNIAVTIPTLQQPLPPGVDSLPGLSSPVSPAQVTVGSKSAPLGQPLPPGVEDEDYSSSYSSFGVSNPSPAIPRNIPVPSYNLRSPNSPVPYRVPHAFPGTSYKMDAPRISPQVSGYSSSFPPPPPPPGGYPSNLDDSAPLNTKRKFSDSDSDESTSKRDKSDSPKSGSREAWDSKMPVPVHGRFSGRGRGFARGTPPGQRGFARPRSGHPSGPPLPRSPPQSPRSRWDTKDSDRKRSRYEPGWSDWESHSSDFDDKHRERSREGHHRDRSREREKSSNSQRSHSTRSNRGRGSDKGSNSPL